MGNIIHYGIGKDYLPKWGIKEALREIFQNFIDYGEYDIEVDTGNNVVAKVTLSNEYKPETLEFLRIGTSIKHGDENIGKHGEGLKMAFLVLGRLGYACTIYINDKSYKPVFVTNGGIDNCFAIKQSKMEIPVDRFTLEFTCPISDYEKFISDIIKPDDKIFTDPPNGSIVDREVGRIYSGGMFVAQLGNLMHAYDILPSNLQLDRDRSVPKQFDVNYHASKINSKYDKWNIKDTTYSDTQYVQDIPQRVKEQVTPKKVGQTIVFTYKDGDEEKVVNNDSVHSALLVDGFFSKIIKRIRQTIIKHLGLYNLLIAFQEKYITSEEANREFNIILNKVKSGEI